MNFSTLKGLTIPEGVVTQIADAQGTVLWSVGAGTVTIAFELVTVATNFSVYINGTLIEALSSVGANSGYPSTYEVNVGDEITFKSAARLCVVVNGVTVYPATMNGSYTYAAVSNATCVREDKSSSETGGPPMVTVTITETLKHHRGSGSHVPCVLRTR